MNTLPLSEWSVQHYGALFRREWKKIIAVVVVTTLITAIVAWCTPNRYSSYTLLIPIKSKGGGVMNQLQSAGMAQLLSAAGGGVTGSSGGDDIGRLEIILKSRTVAERVVEQLELMPLLFPDLWDSKLGRWKEDDPKKQPTLQSAVGVLTGLHVKFNVNHRELTIKIQTYFGNPDIAAKVANGFADALQWFINGNTLTTAKRNRIYISEQLRKNKRELLEEGKRMTDLYRGNRISSVSAEVDVPLDDILLDHGEKVDDRLAELFDQKQKLDEKMSQVDVVKAVPQQVYLSYVTMRQQLLSQITALLASQHEMAKIEENKENLAFQVVDRAIPPEGRYSPRPVLMCRMAALVSLLFSFGFFILKEYQRTKRL